MMRSIGRMMPALLKRSLRASCVIFMCLIIASCGSDKLQGEVTDKTVKPGYDFLYMMPTYTTRCVTVNKINSCSQVQTGTIPIWYHVPECWELTVEGEVSGTTCVDESVWNSTELLDYYEGPDVDPKDRKVRK